MGKKLLIRADGSSQIGVGHIMRMLALAQAWQGGEVTFVIRDCPAPLLSRLEDEGFEVHRIGELEIGSIPDAVETISVANRLGTQWIVLDGYQFGPEYQKRVVESGFKVLSVDDNGHQKQYEAHLVLNQNCYAEKNLYPNCHQRTKLLLGSDYALLRREFLAEGRPERTEGKRPEQILVTLGGSDPQNVTGRVIEGLNEWTEKRLKIRILVGAGFTNIRFQEQMERSPHDIAVIQQPENVADHLRWADAVVTAAGSTVWECLYMRLPLALCITAENQIRVAESLSNVSFIQVLGDARGAGEIDFAGGIRKLLETAYVQGEATSTRIDGEGARRVVSAIG